MILFFIGIGGGLIAAVLVILARIPMYKPKLRIIKKWTYNCYYYQVVRKNLLGGWYIIEVPAEANGNLHPYTYGVYNFFDKNQFETEKDAKEWLQWYLDNRCIYFLKPINKNEEPKDQVIYEYKAN